MAFSLPWAANSIGKETSPVRKPLALTTRTILGATVPTARVKSDLAEAEPSLTVRWITASPVCPAAGRMDSVRFAPAPRW